LSNESLASIAKRVAPKKKYLRDYLVRYEELFLPIRNMPMTVLEIGVGGYKNPQRGGGSLRMWAEFFSRSRIVGIDVFEKRLELPSNVDLHCGSQDDDEFLCRTVALYGGFDIVIDDASHVTAKTVSCFESLIDYTRLCYVIEDLHMHRARGTAEYFCGVNGADFRTKNMCVVKIENRELGK
jgi:hypothetical protein